MEKGSELAKVRVGGGFFALIWCHFMPRWFSVFLVFFSLEVSSQTVVIAADEWFPMNGKPGDIPPGYMVELARRVFGNIDYKLMPWSRAVEEVNAGRVDCVFGADYRVVPNFIFPTEPWGVFQYNVYVRVEDDWVYRGLDSLKSKKVGLIYGYDYSAEINAVMYTNNHVFKLASGTDALAKIIKQLVAGRIDVLIENSTVAKSKFMNMGVSDQIKKAGLVGSPINTYIGCSPVKESSAGLVAKIDEVTKQLRASGELKKILSRYGVQDWKRGD